MIQYISHYFTIRLLSSLIICLYLVYEVQDLCSRNLSWSVKHRRFQHVSAPKNARLLVRRKVGIVGHSRPFKDVAIKATLVVTTPEISDLSSLRSKIRCFQETSRTLRTLHTKHLNNIKPNIMFILFCYWIYLLSMGLRSTLKPFNFNTWHRQKARMGELWWIWHLEGTCCPCLSSSPLSSCHQSGPNTNVCNPRSSTSTQSIRKETKSRGRTTSWVVPPSKWDCWASKSMFMIVHVSVYI